MKIKIPKDLKSCLNNRNHGLAALIACFPFYFSLFSAIISHQFIINFLFGANFLSSEQVLLSYFPMTHAIIFGGRSKGSICKAPDERKGFARKHLD